MAASPGVATPRARSSSTATASPSAAGARPGAPPGRRPACRPASSTIAAAPPPATRRPQTSGATQRCLNPGCSERIGNSRRTGDVFSTRCISSSSCPGWDSRRARVRSGSHWVVGSAIIQPLINVETVDLSAHNFKLPADRVGMVVAQPFLSLTDVEPYRCTALLHESSLARTMPTDRILTGRCDMTLVGRARSSD